MTSIRDVLEALGIETEPPPKRASLSDDAARVLALLDDGAHDADEITRGSGLSSGSVAAALVELELAGLVVQGEGSFRTLGRTGRSVAR